MRSKFELVLKRALLANAIFSLLSAIGCLANASTLSNHIDADSSEFVALGVQLLIFAAALIAVAGRVSAQRLWTLAAGAFFGFADVLWVVGSALVLRGGVSRTPLGSGLIVGVAIVVGLFGLLQLVSVVALLRSRSAPVTV